MRTFLNHIKNETLDEIKTSLENLWQQMIQLSEFFQYSFVLILKRKCLVRASRVRSGESGTPSTIIYVRWSSRHYELGCDTPVLQIYKISFSQLESIQQHINKYLRKWLGVTPCFSTVGLYTTTGMLQLPFSSITEEFKVGKARLHMMLQDSLDDVIHQVQPEVRTGTKWSAAKAVQEAEASPPDQRGHWSHPDRKSWHRKYPALMFFHEDSRGHRDMVITELKMTEEEKRVATISQPG